MIIKKSRFKYSKKGRNIWPFTVPEVTILASTIESNGKPLNAFALVHNFRAYALSGILENYGLIPMKESGIWTKAGKTEQGTQLYKSLQPFFDHIVEEFNKSGDDEGY